jgi:tetratricopeptide (TPR) repeat protein
MKGPRILPVALLIFGIALAVRLFHLWQLHRSPFFTTLMGDARAYDGWAQRLAAGEWLGGEVFYQAPLYPYFLGAIYRVFGRDLTIVRVCQAVIGSASCVLVALTAWRLFSKRAALVAGLGMAVYAPAVFFDGLIQKSVLDVFFMSLALWLLSGIVVREGTDPLVGRPFQGRLHGDPERVALQLFMLGLVMGALSLTRENALLLAAVVLGWIVVESEVRVKARRVRLKADTTYKMRTGAATAFLLGLAVVLLPVAARNYAVGGGFYLTTSQFGPNFFIGNNARSDGTYSSLRAGRGSPEYERQDATELAERAMGRRLTPAEVSSYWTDRALGFITSRPGDWLTLLARKFLLLLNAGEMLDTESQASHAEWSWPLRATGWFAHFGVLVPLALLGVWATWPDRRRLTIFYALALAYAGSVLLFYVFARYRFPLVPMLMLFAAPGLSWMMDQAVRWKKGARPPKLAGLRASGGGGSGGNRSRVAAASVAMAAIVLFTNWPVLSPTLMRAITENNLAAALHEEGRLDEAVAHYERATALRPDYAPAYSNMGAALRAKGRLDEAIAAHRRALAIQPDHADAHFNLANALLDQNKPQEAAEHFRLAGREAPASGNVANNLGIALAAEGKMGEAAAAFRQALEIEPDSARAHRNLGDALVMMGRVDEGVGHLRRAVEIEPANVTFHYDLAVVLLEAGRTPQAIAEFRTALQLDPTFAPAHNNLGVALGSSGRLDEAIDHFRRALTIQPDYGDAQRNLAMAVEARRGMTKK